VFFHRWGMMKHRNVCAEGIWTTKEIRKENEEKKGDNDGIKKRMKENKLV
jgi:hypothetical protein